jgi:hypothetical protein
MKRVKRKTRPILLVSVLIMGYPSCRKCNMEKEKGNMGETLGRTLMQWPPPQLTVSARSNIKT